MDQENNEERKDIIYNQNLPQIVTETKTEVPSGGVLEQNYISVTGKSLRECKKIYDELNKSQKSQQTQKDGNKL